MDFSKYHAMKDSSEKWDQFRVEAIRASGLWGHPMADQIYSEAFDRAGEFGIEEVFEHLDMMADIVLRPVEC